MPMPGPSRWLVVADADHAPHHLDRLVAAGDLELRARRVVPSDGGLSVSTKRPPSLMLRANSEKSSSTVL